MPFSHGSAAKVYANGRNLTTFLKSVSTPGEADTAETSTFGRASKTYIPGMKDGTLSAEGFFDATLITGSDVILEAALGGASSVWTVLPAGDALGVRGVGFDAVETSYELDSSVDGANELSVEAQSKTGRERIVTLHPLTNESAASGQAATYDGAAGSVNGGAGYFQFVSQSLTNWTVKIQHSTDNSVWVDLVTFPTFGSSGNAARVEVTGTVHRYLRASWTQDGAGTATFHVGFHRRPN